MSFDTRNDLSTVTYDLYVCLLVIYLLDKSHDVLMNMVCYTVKIKKVRYIP